MEAIFLAVGENNSTSGYANDHKCSMGMKERQLVVDWTRQSGTHSQIQNPNTAN